MSDKHSYLRLASKQPGDDEMAVRVENDMHGIVMYAAEGAPSHLTIKGKQNFAQRELGNPPLWRIKSAWWRDGCGNWSASAYTDFQDRYRALIARRTRQAENEKRTAVLVASSRPKIEEHAADEYRTLVARIEALEAALRIRS